MAVETEKAEVPEAGWVDRILSIVNKRDRHIVSVLIAVIALGAGSFTAYATATAKGEAAMDGRIEVKVVPTLTDHEKRVLALENHDAAREIRERQADADAAQMRGDIRVIRQVLEDKFGAPASRKDQ
jgi:hypothetical protein